MLRVFRRVSVDRQDVAGTFERIDRTTTRRWFVVFSKILRMSQAVGECLIETGRRPILVAMEPFAPKWRYHGRRCRDMEVNAYWEGVGRWDKWQSRTFCVRSPAPGREHEMGSGRRLPVSGKRSWPRTPSRAASGLGSPRLAITPT